MPFLNEKYFLQMVRTVDNLADVPSAQANVSIVRGALTNLNGRYLSAYTATYTTIGGYACYQIKRGGSVLDAVKASEYMEYMTGSKFVPTYNYEKPINSLFIFATDFTLWKPQYDPTNGLLLFAAGRLTLYSDLMDLKNVTELEINNLKSIVYETVAAIEELDENYAGILPNPTSINSKPVIDETLAQIVKIEGNSAVENETLLDSVVNKIASFSQVWDEVWEQGGLSWDNGTNIGGNVIRSKNYIDVLPNATYFFKCPIAYDIHYYDVNFNHIGKEYKTANTTFVTPSSCQYIRFMVQSSYGTTYKNDISITYGSTNRGYIPYSKLGELLINQTLKGAINAHDTIEFVEQENGTFNAVKTSNIGNVDLGSLIYTYNSSGSYFSAPINDISSSGANDNLCCSKYEATNASLSSMVSGQIKKGTNEKVIYIKDTSYTDEATFKTAMSGVMLNYELATPTTEVIATGLTLDEVAFLIKLGGYIEVDSEEVAPNIKLAYIVKDFQE